MRFILIGDYIMAVDGDGTALHWCFLKQYILILPYLFRETEANVIEPGSTDQSDIKKMEVNYESREQDEEKRYFSWQYEG